MALLPNQNDVFYRSGQNVTYSFAHEQPRHSIVLTSGNATTAYDGRGVQPSVGATAGDDVYVSPESFSEFRGGVFERTILFQTWGKAAPFNTDVRIGFVREGGMSQNEGVACLDLTNGVYRAGSSTQTATLPAQFRGIELRIVVDLNNNETTFEQKGSVEESVTIATAERPRTAVIGAKSNGTDESLPKITRIQNRNIA